MQICRDCRYVYPFSKRVPCLSCDSTRLTIPCSENLMGIVNRLLDKGIEVVSAGCYINDLPGDTEGKEGVGKTVLLQIELGYLYDNIFMDLPPDWITYKYHTVEDNKIGSEYTGLSHTENFAPFDDEELEFATSLTISNLELYLDDLDNEGFKAVLRLSGYAVD